MRYFIQFSYFGEGYHGWQKQPNTITIQSVLEDALSKLLRAEISLTGAGRTDAGVHAKQMFAHFDVEKIADLVDLTYRVNAFLPTDIAVQNFISVKDEAHARFDAFERTYEYWVTPQKNVFLITKAHYVKHLLDVQKMNTAAKLLLNHVDFECFSKSNTDVRTFNCDISFADWQIRDQVLVFTITADRFLRNMVRAVVGTLLDIGTGKTQINGLQRILDSKDRSEAGTSVPAKGLYLTRVKYPENTFRIDG